MIITQKKTEYKEWFMMSKKVLIISSSPRKGGNSETLAAAFAKGAKDAGNQVETVFLREKQYGFCKGCLACQKLGRCVINDDAAAITEKMHDADVIVFATPIYYYEMSGQLKTLLDRANSLYSSDYKFRDIYFLSTAAEDGDGVDERAIHGLGGWIECYPKCRLCGTVFAGGVNGPNEMSGHSALKKAYDMGNSIK